MLIKLEYLDILTHLNYLMLPQDDDIESVTLFYLLTD